jgi:hypothetical protein
MTLEWIPEDVAERQLAGLAFMTVLGAGIIAYHAAEGIREGDILKTSGPETADVSVFAIAGGVGLTLVSMKEAAAEVGLAPIALGSVGLLAVALLLK